MAKNKSSEIPHYELLSIISNKYSEDEVNPIIEKIKKIITDIGGEVTYYEFWGKKRLSYPIKGFRHGYYFLLEFDLDGEKAIKVDRALRLADEILRHQMIGKKKKTIKEIEQEKIKQEKSLINKVVAKKEEIKEKTEDKKDEDKKEKVDLKDLDKKLDKILESDDLL